MTASASIEASVVDERQDRSAAYLDRDLKGQERWYSSKAAVYKKRSNFLSLLLIAAGTLTSSTQIFAGAAWLPFVTVILGSLVAIVEGWRRIAQYADHWQAYRVASERMKREQRLYINKASHYRNLDEDLAYITFVESIELIIAEEQKIYWKQGSPIKTTDKSDGK